MHMHLTFAFTMIYVELFLRLQLLKPEDKGKLVHMYLTLAFTMLSPNLLRVELLKLGCRLKCNLVVKRVVSYVIKLIRFSRIKFIL